MRNQRTNLLINRMDSDTSSLYYKRYNTHETDLDSHPDSPKESKILTKHEKSFLFAEFFI